MQIPRLRVYVAGPITGSGDLDTNLNAAVDAGQKLWTEGFVPFIPHLDERWGARHPKGRHEWLDYDRHWFVLCHLLLRLPGGSPGSDQEEEWAKQLEMPIFYSVESLLDEYKDYREMVRTHEELHPLGISPNIPN